MSLAHAALGVLAVWRVTHALHAEDGPGDALVKLRALAGDGLPGQVLDCFYCLSVWVALPVAVLVGEGFWEVVLAWPALSGGAVLLERVTAPKPPPWREDPPGSA